MPCSLIPERSGEATCVPCSVLKDAITNTYNTTLDATLTNSLYMAAITAALTDKGLSLPAGIDDVGDILALCSIDDQVIPGCSSEDAEEITFVWLPDADPKRTLCPDGSLSFTNSTRYRFGFNGQERDDNVAGEGNINTAEFWEYDTRIAYRWNIDPEYDETISSYAVFNSNPIYNIDPLGNTPSECCGTYIENIADGAVERIGSIASSIKEFVSNPTAAYINKLDEIRNSIDNGYYFEAYMKMNAPIQIAYDNTVKGIEYGNLIANGNYNEASKMLGGNLADGGIALLTEGFANYLKGFGLKPVIVEESLGMG